MPRIDKNLPEPNPQYGAIHREIIRDRARKLLAEAASFRGSGSEAIGAIIGECDWWTEMKLLNDEALEEERLP